MSKIIYDSPNRIRSELRNVRDFLRANVQEFRWPIIDGMFDLTLQSPPALFSRNFVNLHICHFQDSPSTPTFELAVQLLQGDLFPQKLSKFYVTPLCRDLRLYNATQRRNTVKLNRDGRTAVYFWEANSCPLFTFRKSRLSLTRRDQHRRCDCNDGQNTIRRLQREGLRLPANFRNLRSRPLTGFCINRKRG